MSKVQLTNNRGSESLAAAVARGNGVAGDGVVVDGGHDPEGQGRIVGSCRLKGVYTKQIKERVTKGTKTERYNLS